ncbi:hypothetical protein J6590_078720 [Homalodisca vitripennis]|nr:hypothetical protein J6590_078720 [Homalodisca vitripennis]
MFPRFEQSLCGCGLRKGSICTGIFLVGSGAVILSGLFSFTRSESWVDDENLILTNIKLVQGIVMTLIGILAMFSVYFKQVLFLKIEAGVLLFTLVITFLGSCILFVIEPELYLAALFSDMVWMLTSYLLGASLWSYAMEVVEENTVVVEPPRRRRRRRQRNITENDLNVTEDDLNDAV